MIMVKYNKSCSILSKWPFRKQILGLGLDDVGAPTRLGCQPAKKTLQKLEVLSYVSSWGARILRCKNYFKKIAQAVFLALNQTEILEDFIIHTISNIPPFCTKIYFFVRYVKKQTKMETVIGLNPQSGTHYYPVILGNQSFIRTLPYYIFSMNNDN